MHRCEITGRRRVSSALTRAHRLRCAGRVLRRCASFGIGLLVLAAVLIRVLPLTPSFPGADPESAWRFALNEAVSRGLVFGQDIVYTFGPYASVLTANYHPATDAICFVGSAVLATSLAAGLIVLGSSKRRYPLILIPTIMILSLIPDPIMFLEPLVFLAIVCRLSRSDGDPDRLRLDVPVGLGVFGLTLSLALLILVKASFIGPSIAIVALACGLLTLRRHAGLAIGILLAFALSALAFWTVAGQPLAALPRFFFASAAVMAGYSEGMALNGLLSEVFAYLACAGILLAVFYLGYGRRAGLVGSVFGCGLAIIFFLSFKAGFVRHDVHAVIASTTLALSGSLMALELPPIHAGVAVVAGLAAFLFIGSHHREGLLHRGSQAERQLSNVAQGLWARVAHPRELDRTYSYVLSELRDRWVKQPVRGRVDVYSSGQWGVLANRMDWSPRPNIQSITAYTPWLQNIDLEHLEGAHAPTTIFLRIEPIDGRLPSLEDALSWPALVSEYAISSFDKGRDLARLERRPKQEDRPPAVPGKALVNASYPVGVQVPLPTGPGPFWAQLDIQPTALGRIFALLYKPPILYITLSFPDTHTETYRYVPGMGRAGFVISPAIRNTAGFISLALPNRHATFPDDYPRSIGISGERGTRWLWRSSFGLRVFALDLPAQPGVEKLILPP